MTAEPTLPELPANAALLAYLRSQAVPGHNSRTDDLGAWELHTHPDLIERLAQLAPGWPMLPMYGVPVLAYEGIAAVVAISMNVLLVRLPRLPSGLEPARPVPPLTDQDWCSVDAWQSELTSAESRRRLSGLLRGAREVAKGYSTKPAVSRRIT